MQRRPLQDESESKTNLGRSWNKGSLTFVSYSGGQREEPFEDIQTTETDQVLITKSVANIRYAFNGGRYAEEKISPYQFAFMPKGASVHAQFEPRPSSISIRIPTYLREQVETDSMQACYPDEPMRFSNNLTNSRAIISLIDDFLSSDGFGGLIRAESIATLLISDLHRVKPTINDDISDAGALGPSKVALVAEYIDTYIDEKVSLCTLANLVNVSPFHFSRLFKAATGLPPHQFVLQHRVSKAKSLLSSNNFSLAEIAYSCGFSSQSHMSTAFQKIVGTSPGKFRKISG